MSRRIGEYNEGTSAYSMHGEMVGSCKIIRPDFPRSHAMRNHTNMPEPKMRFTQRVFEGSELLCSLAYEDHRGCAYGIFSRGEVIATSIILTALSALAIALGA